MKATFLILAALLLLTLSPLDEHIRFELSEKQQQEGWRLEHIDKDIAQLIHPAYGYIKHVKLTAPKLSINKPASDQYQIIDLRDADTSIYSGLFEKITLFPASGGIGYPVQIGDFNHNGLLDFNGAYKWEQDFELADGCVVEFSADSNFILKKIYRDTLIEPLPPTDLDKNGFLEMNFRQNRKFAQLKSETPDSFPDSIGFTYRMWKGGGGEVSAEVLADLDKDGNMDLLYVGDDTLEPAGAKKIFIAEYNPEIDNFEQKFRHHPDDFSTYGHSYGDFDNDGFIEFVTGSIHGDVYVFENSGNDSYGLVYDDTLSTSNAYLTVATNDLDNNGKIEFLLGGSSYFNGVGGTRFYWFEANGDNSYEKVRSFFLLGVDPLSWDEIHTFDVNNDGKDDILINYTYTVVILTWNNIEEEFEIFYLSYWDYPVHGTTMYGLNNNGRLDFFISTKENDKIPALRTYYYENKSVTDIDVPAAPVPSAFTLKQNYPNPFNGKTQIPFSLKNKSAISLKIYTILGREVTTLIDIQIYSPGQHSVGWNGRDRNGKEVSSGVYYYVLSDGSQTSSGKMLLIK